MVSDNFSKLDLYINTFPQQQYSINLIQPMLRNYKFLLGWQDFNCAKLAFLMTNRLNANQEDIQQRSFDCLKFSIGIAPILTIADPSQPFLMKMDPNDHAIGDPLIQGEILMAFESKFSTLCMSKNFLLSFMLQIDGNITSMVLSLRLILP